MRLLLLFLYVICCCCCCYCALFSPLCTLFRRHLAHKKHKLGVFFIFCTFSFVSTRLKYFCIPRVIYNFCLSFECAYMNMYILVRRFLCGFVWFVSLANQCKSFHSSTMSDWLFQCRRWVIINVVVVIFLSLSISITLEFVDMIVIVDLYGSCANIENLYAFPWWENQGSKKRKNECYGMKHRLMSVKLIIFNAAWYSLNIQFRLNGPKDLFGKKKVKSSVKCLCVYFFRCVYKNCMDNNKINSYLISLNSSYFFSSLCIHFKRQTDTSEFGSWHS